MTPENILEHFGVKGMKWGVRKKARSGVEKARTTAKSLDPRPPLSKKEQAVRNQRLKAAAKRRTISDEDLKNYIDRLSNEKKLKELVDQDLQPGRSATKQILGDSGKKVARTVVAGAALYGIKVAVDRKFGKDSGAANFIAPRPKNK